MQLGLMGPSRSLRSLLMTVSLPLAAILSILSIDHPLASSATPVLLIHGYSPYLPWQKSSNPEMDPCPGNPRSDWNVIESSLRNHGRGNIEKVQYYACDDAGGTFIDGHGQHYSATQGHLKSSGDGHLSHHRGTPLAHLAYHLAWYIWDTYSSRGQDVDIVAHSMGGIIVRWMLYVEQQRPGNTEPYPPALYVAHVVTYATPHNGSDKAYFNDGIGQAYEMKPGSQMIQTLNQYGDNPQGGRGTAWTLIGSDGDHVVSADSATHMTAAEVARAIYKSPAVEHCECLGGHGYLTDSSNTDDAHLRLSANHCGTTDGPDVTPWPHVAEYTGIELGGGYAC